MLDYVLVTVLPAADTHHCCAPMNHSSYLPQVATTVLAQRLITLIHRFSGVAPLHFFGRTSSASLSIKLFGVSTCQILVHSSAVDTSGDLSGVASGEPLDFASLYLLITLPYYVR